MQKAQLNRFDRIQFNLFDPNRILGVSDHFEAR